MNSDLLFRLPASLANETLGRWLCLKELTNLDSAYCNHTLRPSWIQLLQADEFLFYDQISADDSTLWSWLFVRKVRVASVALNFPWKWCEASTNYLQQFGQSMREIRVNEEIPVDMTMISNCCAHLTHFYYSSVYICDALHDILQRNPNLQVLQLGGVKDLTVADLDGISLPHLRTISINHCSACDDEVALALARLSTKVTKFYLSGQVSNPTLLTIAAMFPKLQVFCLGGFQVDNATLDTITKTCPHITDLVLFGNEAVTDAGLEKVLRNLHSLRVLDIQACLSLTDPALAHIAKYSAKTLQELHIGERMTYDCSCVGSMLTACTKLRNFIWCVPNSIDIDEYDLVPVFTAMRNIRTLLLGDGMACDDALCLVGQHCTQLQNLNIFRSSSFFVQNEDFDDDDYMQINYTADGVLALVQGCPQLRTVVCKGSYVVNGLAKLLWQQLCPQVEFSEDNQLFCSDTLHESF